MPSLRSSGRIQGPAVSVRELARPYRLPSPLSARQLIAALGVGGDPAIPFVYGTHNLSFGNFSDGVPSWDTFEETFGAAEVWHEQLDPVFGHPILTAAFFALYKHFLKGTHNGGLATGFCTSLASLVADHFWTGRMDTPSITLDSVHAHLTAVHGKLLSRESLIKFHDQGREGIARVERSCREVEATFLRGCGRRNAPLVFFIPSGAVWDSGYIDKLGSSHCVMPYRFAYPAGHPGPQLTPDGKTTATDLHGVELFVWDCNRPTSPDCKLVFSNTGGQLDFEYFPGSGAAQFSSRDGITLGMMTNGEYLLADHDLPFSGPAGLTRFVFDFLLSPADMQITDGAGLRTGNIDGQLRADIPGSHLCYLLPRAYLLPEQTALTRRITGTGAGRYTYGSIAAQEGTLMLNNVETAPGQEDVLTLNAERTELRFSPAAEKRFDVVIGKQVGNQARGIVVRGAGGGPAADLDIALAPELSGISIINRGAARQLEVSGSLTDTGTNAQLTTRLAAVNLDPATELKVEIHDWTTLGAGVQALRLA